VHDYDVAIVFDSFEMYPREGYLLWVVGMLLVVSSAELSQLLRLDRNDRGVFVRSDETRE
jgi:hypothetical protein